MITHNLDCSKETDFLEQNSSVENTSHFTGQEILSPLWNLVIHAEMTRAHHWKLIHVRQI
jgi:hypothetical protein